MNWTTMGGGQGNLPRESWEPDGLAPPRRREAPQPPAKQSADRRNQRRKANRQANERLRALSERLKEQADRQVAAAGVGLAVPGASARDRGRLNGPLASPASPVVGRVLTRLDTVARNGSATSPRAVVDITARVAGTPNALRGAWHGALVACHVRDAQISFALGDPVVRAHRCVTVPTVYRPKRPKSAARLLKDFELHVLQARQYADRAARVMATGGGNAKLAAFAAEAEPLIAAFEDALDRRLAPHRRESSPRAGRLDTSPRLRR